MTVLWTKKLSIASPGSRYSNAISFLPNRICTSLIDRRWLIWRVRNQGNGCPRDVFLFSIANRFVIEKSWFEKNKRRESFVNYLTRLSSTSFHALIKVSINILPLFIVFFFITEDELSFIVTFHLYNLKHEKKDLSVTRMFNVSLLYRLLRSSLHAN